MNKLLFLGKGVLLLCLFATHFVQAQTVSTAYATQINATFANLDKTKIPHKLLVDYAMEFEELSAYNGTLTTQNLVNAGNYKINGTDYVNAGLSLLFTATLGQNFININSRLYRLKFSLFMVNNKGDKFVFI